MAVGECRHESAYGTDGLAELTVEALRPHSRLKVQKLPTASTASG
jgi:hypothetical protein